MALTKVGKEGITGISNSSDATAITIDSSENVGIGTTSPTFSAGGGVHVKGSSGAFTSYRASVDSNTGTDFAADSDGNGYVSVRDNANLLLRTNNTERVRIDSSGRVLINRTSSSSVNPHSKLHVLADSAVSAATIQIGTNGYAGISFLNASGSDVGSIVINASSTAYNTSSDYRLKENVADMTGAIDRVKALAPKRFNFIVDADTTVDGFLAHEAQAVVPEAVTGTKDEVDEDGNAVMQGIDQSKLVPLLTGALREAIAEIETLKTKVAALEGS